jgi:membrane protein
MQIKSFFPLAKKAVMAWIDDYAPSMGAAIAFYTVFSLAPLIILVLAIAGFFWGQEAVQGQLMGQMGGLLGQDGAQAIEGVVSASAQEKDQGIIATVSSLVVLAVGATTVFAELQSALDRIWEVPASEKKSGIWNMIRSRLLSFGLVLSLAFLLLVSLVVSTALAALGSWMGGLMPGWELLLQILNLVVSFAILTVLFAMIFKFMPQVHVAWRDVWVGALLTALLFVIGKYLIGLYVGKSSVASSYAAAGSLVIVLLWVYYAAQVFLLGAEFTWVYATEHGSLKGSRGENPGRKNAGKPTYPKAQADAGRAPERVSYRS